MSLNDNLVAHYTLDTLNIIDETGNTTLNDFESNRPEQTTGKIGGAIKFQEDTHIAINDSQEFDEAPISAGCWVKPTADLSSNYGNKGMLGKWDGSNQWILWTQTGSSFNPTVSVVDDQNNRADLQGPTPTQESGHTTCSLTSPTVH
jgi:hypothetical protein